MENKKSQELSLARKGMIKALRLTVAGNVGLAKKELAKAQKELSKQYKKA